MAIVVDTLHPFTQTEPKKEWTGEPTESTIMWNKLNKTSKEGEAEPATTPFVKTKTASKFCTVNVRKVSGEVYKLPAGVTLLAIRVFWNLKSGSATAAKGVALEVSGSLAGLKAAFLATDVNTAQHWAKGTATSASTGWAEVKKALEEAASEVQVTFKSKEAPAAFHEGYEVYVEIEYEEAAAPTSHPLAMML